MKKGMTVDDFAAGINWSFDMETSSRLQFLKPLPLQVHADSLSNRQQKSHEVHADMT